LLLAAVGGGVGFAAGPPTLGPLIGAGGGLLLFAAWAVVTNPATPPTASRPQPPPDGPLRVVYTPAPPQGPSGPPGPDEAELLTLCQNDAALFERLVRYERENHPHLDRAELVRLARDHFRRDRS
jgi:hypothetical protein